MLALEQSTEEYRIAQGKLNTAFEAAGYGAETANKAYTEFYKILGDTDTATEASQLLAKLAQSEEDVAIWTNIAAGVSGTFGDSLPIEGLIEASNETAKVGQVTGVLADALNWAGINEDDFNAKLAECTDESSRNQLIMDALASTYDDAADAFYRNNEQIVSARENQAALDKTLATLGQTVSDIKNRLMGEFLPSVTSMIYAFNGLITGVSGSDKAFSDAVENILSKLTDKLPQFLNMGAQILTAIAGGIVNVLPQLLDTAVQIILQLSEFITQSLPEIIPAAVSLILELVDGIIDHIDLLIDGAIALISALAEGLINSIPILVEKAPEIISKLVNALIENAKKLLDAAKEIISNLWQGLSDGFNQLKEQVKTWVNDTILQPIKDKFNEFVDAGRNLVEGIWDGITDKVQWLKDKVSGVVDTIKGWFTGSDGFDEASPSKWSRKVFRYVMDGGALGLDDGLGNVMQSVRDAGDTIKNGLNFGTANVDFASSGLGVSSAGIINSIGGDYGYAEGLTVNLTLPDGTKFATWQLPYLIKAGSAAGTPIAEAQRA